MPAPTLTDVLLRRYPQAEPLRDWEVEDRRDGRGARIVRWNPALGPQPDEATLLAEWTPADADLARDRARLRALDRDEVAVVIQVLLGYLNAVRAALPTPQPPVTTAQIRADLVAALRARRGD